METRKSDEVGEVGQETIGPLTLSRPKGNPWLVWMCLLLFSFGNGCWGDSVKSYLKVQWNWQEMDARMGAQLPFILLLAATIFLSETIGKKAWAGRDDLELEIERGNGKPVSLDERFEIWAEPNRPLRVHSIFCNVVWGLFCLCLASSENIFIRIVGASGFLVSAYALFRSISETTRPLLVADDTELKILGRRVDWKTVQKVEVKHVCTMGEFREIQLTFCGNGPKKLAKISLPKAQCSIPTEDALLELIAARLGRRVKNAEYMTPDWI